MYEAWYRRAKETNRGEMHVRKSEQPDSTSEVGELEPKRSRRREAGCRNIGSLFRNTSDAWKFGQCINGTAADSNLGAAFAGVRFHIACSLHDA